jgi:hypothetical protein
MTEAGVKDPMMLVKPKLNNKKYASEEQVVQWEKQTLSSLLAVQKQMDKTCSHIDKDLEDMSKFLNKADKLLEREKEINGRRPASPDEFGGSQQLPTLSSASTAKRPDSRVKCRLREIVEHGREEEEDEEDECLPAASSIRLSPQLSPSRLSPAAAAAAAAAACDEEISEDEHGPLVDASPVASSPEPAEEVDEELHGGEDDTAASNLTIGPRAARALANAAAMVASGDAKTSGGPDQPALRVDKRSAARQMNPVLEGQKRPGSSGTPGSQGRGGQPSQGQRTRPKAAPVRSSSRGKA